MCLLSYTSPSKQKKRCPSPQCDRVQKQKVNQASPPAALSPSFLAVILTCFRWDLLECLYLRNNNHCCYLKLPWVERRGAHDLPGYLGPQGLELGQWKPFRPKARERTRRKEGAAPSGACRTGLGAAS